MGITASSMKDKIKANIDAVAASQGSDPAAALAHRDAVLLAMCQGIVDEIKQNAVVTTGDAQGGTNSGTVA